MDLVVVLSPAPEHATVEEITGTDGDMEVSNERAFVTKHHDTVRGAQGDARPWMEIEIPDHLRMVPPSDLDVSVQGLAQLYAASRT